MKDAPHPPFFPLALRSDKVNPTRKAKEVAQKIAEDLQSPNRMPKEQTLIKFDTLTRLVRVMSQKEILDVAYELYAAQKNADFYSDSAAKYQAAWKAYRDAVAEAGTPASFACIAQLIEDGKVRENEAAALIATQERALRYPTKQVLKRFQQLAEDKKVLEQYYLNATTVTTFASVVRRAQVENRTAYAFYPTHAYGRLSSRKAVNLSEIATIFERKLSYASKNEDSEQMLTYIRALGNLGHPVILKAFEPFLEGDKPATDFQRLAMVVAMDKLAINYPKAARAVLFKIFQTTAERSEVRSAAVFQLMRTNPPAPMLQQMASMTNYDKSEDVVSAVRSALESAAELDHEDDRELRENAQAAVRLLERDLGNAQNSQSKITDFVMEELNLAYKMQASAIGSDNTLAHKALFINTVKNMGGYKNRFNQYQVMASDLKNLLYAVSDKVYSGSSRNEDSKHQEQPKSNGQFSFKKIEKLFNIENEIVDELEAQIMGKIGNTNRFWTFNNETINQIPSMVRRAAKALENGQQFNATKWFNQEEITIAFPLASGLPFIFKYVTPTVMHAGGEIRVKTSPLLSEGRRSSIRAPKSVEAYAEIEALYSSAVESQIGFMSLVDNQHYFAAVQKKIQARLPFKASIKYDAEHDNVQVELEPLNPKKDITFLHASQWPYVVRRDMLAALESSNDMHLHTIQAKRPNTFDKRFGMKAAGFSIRAYAEYDQDFVDYARVMQYINRNDFVSLFMYATQSETNDHYQVEFKLEADRSEAQSVKAKFQFAGRDTFHKLNNQQSRHPKDTQQRGNLAYPQNTSANSKDRIKQFIDNANDNINNADISVVDASFTFQGKQAKIAQYIATFAFANSKYANRQRFLAFMQSNTAAGYNKQACVHADYEMPSLPQLNFEDALTQKEDGRINILADFGDNCKNDQHINIKMKMQQSSERRKYVSKSAEAEQCRYQMKRGDYMMPACQNATYEANVYDQYTITFEADKLSEKMKKFASAALDYARHIGYDYLSVEHHPDNKLSKAIKAEISLSPDMSSLNATLYAKHTTRWTNIELPEYANLLAVHPDNDIIDRIAYMATDGDSEREFETCYELYV